MRCYLCDMQRLSSAYVIGQGRAGELLDASISGRSAQEGYSRTDSGGSIKDSTAASRDRRASGAAAGVQIASSVLCALLLNASRGISLHCSSLLTCIHMPLICDSRLPSLSQYHQLMFMLGCYTHKMT